MKKLTLLILLAWVSHVASAQNIPQWNPQLDSKNDEQDWLIKAEGAKANVYKDGDKIILYNALVKRVFTISPDVACVDYKNLANNQQLLRAVKQEAIVNINGKDYNVGGLYGQKENAYLLPEWVKDLKKDEKAFNFKSYQVSEITPFLDWKTDFWTPSKKRATGKQLSFAYTSSLSELKDIEVIVNYELYDNAPLVSKWVEIKNNSKATIYVNRVVNEILGMVEEESSVFGSTADMHKPSGIYFETNYAFNNAMQYRLSDQTLHWEADSTYTSQVNYSLKTPCLVKVYPSETSQIDVKPNEKFTSVKTFEMLMDSHDRERRGLAVRKMYRIVSPWITSNPIFMHVVCKDDKEVYTAIDQCQATGYEAVIVSFGSNFNMELNTKENHARWKKIADYAHKKGVKIGGYTLFSSRSISEEMDVINPKTGKTGGTFFNNAPCLASQWGLDYAQAILDFYKNTGFDILEMDGPYPGDVCASTKHPGHNGTEDSQWKQMEIQKNIFHKLNESGVYINTPDWYFLDGGHKIGLGYREVNFSLSREQQKVLNRQNIFDGTWEKTPSMGWGFVPLTEYQGGGADAVLEPLDEHLQDYKDLMVQYYAAGVQACYRGPRLYDTERTRKTVAEVVSWYKEYREIMNADIVHLRRPDGRDWDGIMHVDPNLKEKGFAILYNPTDKEMVRKITLPLYYTGLTQKALVSENGNTPKEYTLDRNFSIDLTVTIPAKGNAWFVIK